MTEFKPGDIVRMTKGEPDTPGYECRVKRVGTYADHLRNQAAVPLTEVPTLIRAYGWTIELVERPANPKGQVYRNATLVDVEFERWVEDEFGVLSPHPEFPHRHTARVMLAEGDKLPDITTNTRVTIIFENGGNDD